MAHIIASIHIDLGKGQQQCHQLRILRRSSPVKGRPFIVVPSLFCYCHMDAIYVRVLAPIKFLQHGIQIAKTALVLEGILHSIA